MPESSSRSCELPERGAGWRLSLLFALFFPMFLTWVYFVAGQQSPQFQKTAYCIGKFIQFTFPVFWIVLYYRNRRSLPQLLFCANLPAGREGCEEPEARFSWPKLFEGLAFGLLVGVSMIAIFVTCRDLPVFTEGFTRLDNDLRTRFTALGLCRPLPYIILGVFYAVFHSALEEYYWRWFVYGRLRCTIPRLLAAILAAIGFTLHHAIILSSYFGVANVLTWLCCLGIAIGGFYWCLLYERSRSVLGIWLGHGLIDAAIFVVGYMVLFRAG